MVDIVVKLFQDFAYETGILGEIRQYEKLGMWCLLFLSVIALVWGFKAYRAFFSVLVFMGFTVAICLILTDKTDWGTIVTTFAVLGTVIALLSYNWGYLGGISISVLITCGVTFMLSGSIVVMILVGILFVVLVVQLPVVMICLTLALWGSLMLTELTKLPDGILFVSGLTLFGFLFQMLVNKKQTLFKKPYPTYITDWLERRSETRHVNSLQKRD